MERRREFAGRYSYVTSHYYARIYARVQYPRIYSYVCVRTGLLVLRVSVASIYTLSVRYLLVCLLVKFMCRCSHGGTADCAIERASQDEKESICDLDYGIACMDANSDACSVRACLQRTRARRRFCAKRYYYRLSGLHTVVLV